MYSEKSEIKKKIIYLKRYLQTEVFFSGSFCKADRVSSQNRGISRLLPINIIAAFKRSQVCFYMLYLQLVLYRVAPVKSFPVHHS